MPGAHKAEAPLTFVQLAETRAYIALDAAIFGKMPVAAWHAVHGQLSHIETSVMGYHLGISSEMGNPMGTRTADRTTRPPAVAGQFYPADPDRLRAEVSMLLAAAPRAAPSGRPKAIIAPHAGYRYSGQIAAAAFATLEGSAKSIERVVLIGPAHYVPFRGITVPTVNAFATPLGRVPLNSDEHVAITALPRVQAADAPHAPEHALEVELPFLQVLLPRFTAVLLLVSDARPEEVAAVLDRLWGGPETVLVISSDLSHFHDYETAQRRDAETAAAIERGILEGSILEGSNGSRGSGRCS